MNEDNSTTGVILFLVALSVFFGISYFSLTSKIKDYRTALAQANNNIDTANDNISDANDSIDTTNSSIDDAQSVNWSDYDEMGDAIDNLEPTDTIDTIDNISDPHPKK